MPLKKGYGKKSFEHNVGAEIHAGKPPAQALAIAYAVKREAEKRSRKRATPR